MWKRMTFSVLVFCICLMRYEGVWVAKKTAQCNWWCTHDSDKTIWADPSSIPIEEIQHLCAHQVYHLLVCTNRPNLWPCCTTVFQGPLCALWWLQSMPCHRMQPANSEWQLLEISSHFGAHGTGGEGQGLRYFWVGLSEEMKMFISVCYGSVKTTRTKSILSSLS